METTSKQPDESFTIKGGFSRVLTSGETINLGNSSVVAVDVDDVDVTNTLLTAGSFAISSDAKGLTVPVKAAGTVAKSPYKITFICATNAGNIWELDIELVIYDE